MSSHHVVRESQEPALIVQDYKALDIESFGQLLEWSPTIITNEESFDFLLSEGIKVDVIFSNSDYSDIQEHIIQIPGDEGNYIDNALMYLIHQKYNAVNILCNELPKFIPAVANKINIVLFYNGKRFVLVESYFEKWKPQGARIYIQEQDILSCQGLKLIDDNTYEVCSDGFIKIELNITNFVIIGEDI